MSLLEKALEVPMLRNLKKTKRNEHEVDELIRAFLEGKVTMKQAAISLGGSPTCLSNTFYSNFTSAVRRMFYNGEIVFTKIKK